MQQRVQMCHGAEPVGMAGAVVLLAPHQRHVTGALLNESASCLVGDGA